MNINDIKIFSITKIDTIVAVVIFIFIFVVYMKFLAPSIFQGDPAEYCIAAYTLGIPHPNGYPVYTWIGHIFTLIPVGSIAYRVNLMSAFFGAATVSLIYFIVLKIAKWNKKLFYDENMSISSSKSTQNSYIHVYRYIAVVAALSLAFSQTFWSQSEFAEVYTFNAFFNALMVLILLNWSENKNKGLLYGFFLIYGLSIGAHASNILFMPVFLLFIALINYKVFLNIKNQSLFILLFILGLSQFLYILIRSFQYPEYSVIYPGINQWWELITAKQYSHYFAFSIPEIPQRILMYLKLLMANFLVLGSILGITGIISLFKKNKKVFILLMLMLLSNVFFYLNYYVFDVEVMFIPSFLVFSIFIGIGIITIFDFIKNKSDIYEEKISYNSLNIDIFKLTMIIFLIISALMPLSFYFVNQDQIKQTNGDNYAYFAYNALGEVPSNSTIITYWRSYTAFKYFQIAEKVNPEVRIIAVENENLLNATDQSINNTNVFVVHDIDYISQKYYLTPILEVPGTGIYKVEKIN